MGNLKAYDDGYSSINNTINMMSFINIGILEKLVENMLKKRNNLNQSDFDSYNNYISELEWHDGGLDCLEDKIDELLNK